MTLQLRWRPNVRLLQHVPLKSRYLVLPVFVHRRLRAYECPCIIRRILGPCQQWYDALLALPWAAEYAVIPHLNSMGTSVVVDYIYVEWHDAFESVSEEMKVQARAAVAAMELAGTRFPAYDSPA